MTKYIDITQLVHWPGRLTGIPRVMNELSVRFAKDSRNKFVTWDSVSNCFYELDVQASLEKRGQGIFYAQQEPTHSFTKAYRNRLPNTKIFLKDILKSSVRRYPKVYNKLAGVVQKHARAGAEEVQLTPGDMLTVLWGEWGDQGYVDKLTTLHGNSVKIVQVVYDMLPIVTPQYSGHSTESMKKYYAAIIPLCDLVLSISEYTKKDLVNWLNVRRLKVPRVETFRLGDDFKLARSERPKGDFSEKISTGEKFLLCVGTIEARKNHALLYYVYKLAAAKKTALPKIVIVGRKGWRAENIYDIIKSDPQTKDSFIFLESASDEELSWLYRNCLFTVYPSFYEGWGLPIAESIAYGTPCLSSNTSSMPEIAGSLIQYFNPSSSDECLDKVLLLLKPSEYREAKKQVQKYKTTSWDHTFKQADNYIKDVYNAKN